jgi:phytoene dehydrogenase-like protein
MSDEITIGGYLMTHKWDVVIIGGGLAGYVAANYLAKSDLSILIVEKGNKSGGRARTDLIKQQYFNLGPHALYKKGNAKPILDELGITLHGKSPNVGGLLIEGNNEYKAPFSTLGLMTTNLLNWKERIEWIKVLLKVSTIDSTTAVNQTFEQWVTQTTNSIKVQTLLYVLGRLSTYSHAPEMVSARVILSHLKLVFTGVLYVDGGWQIIIDQLHNKAVISGVHVKLRTTVNKISKDEKDFKVILSNDEEILSKFVISTTSPHELTTMLSKMTVIPKYGYTPVKGATLDVALTKLPNPKKLFALGLNDPYYYSVHSNDARLSEDSTSIVLHVFKYHHPGAAIDGKKVKKELEQFLERIQPGWQQFLITSRYLPNITVNQRLPQLGDEQQLLRSKAEISGLYIAGDWASPSYILSEGAVSSGKQAAESIIKDSMG